MTRGSAASAPPAPRAAPESRRRTRPGSAAQTSRADIFARFFTAIERRAFSQELELPGACCRHIRAHLPKRLHPEVFVHRVRCGLPDRVAPRGVHLRGAIPVRAVGAEEVGPGDGLGQVALVPGGKLAGRHVGEVPAACRAAHAVHSVQAGGARRRRIWDPCVPPLVRANLEKTAQKQAMTTEGRGGG